MSFLDRFRSRKEPITEEDLARRLGGDASWTGKDVDRVTAMGISATWAAVRLLSDSVASLPLVYYRRTDKGKEKVPGDPLFALLGKKPNPEETSYAFRETMQHHLLLRGNAYSRVIRDFAGRPMQLWPLDVEKMKVVRALGELKYLYSVSNGPPEVLLPEDVLHIPGLGWDGITGYAPLDIAVQEFGYSIAVKEYGSEFFKNDGTPGGYLKLEHKLKDEAAVNRLKSSWSKSHSDWGSKHSIGVLENGAEWKQMALPPEHMQFLGSQKLTVTDIARIFRVPPHMIGDLERATFSNIEQQSLDFVINSLRPWLVRWEQNLNNQIIPEGLQDEYFFEFNVNALLRGDMGARSQAYRTFIEMGVMTQNEVRALENQNTEEGLDKHYVPLNWQEIIPPEEEDEMGGDDNIQQTALNGAQIKSLLEIITGVAVGDITEGTAKGIIEAGFPGISESLISQMLSNVEPVEKPDEPTGAFGEDDEENSVRMIDGVETRQTRAAKARFRLSNSFKPLFTNAVERVVRKEARDIRKGIKKYLGTRGDEEFDVFLDEFYEGLPKFLRQQVTPTYRTFAESVKVEVGKEINTEGELTAADEEFIGSFVTVFIGRYIDKSKKDLQKARDKAVAEGADVGEAIEARVDHWEETRAATVAGNETVRSGNAFAKVFMIAGGVTLLRWVAAGDSCPFCDSLDGTVVGVDQDFALADDVIQAEGNNMPVNSKIGHPPIHRGCDCQIVAEGV